jgi:hypothetical protein
LSWSPCILAHGVQKVSSAFVGSGLFELILWLFHILSLLLILVGSGEVPVVVSLCGGQLI